MSCTSSACHQGRRPCPTPEACRAPLGATDADPIDALLAVCAWAFATIVVGMAAAMVAFL